MNETDRPAFVQLMTGALAFAKQDVSAFALSVWWAACQPFDIEQVRKALTAHAMDPDRGHFPPRPSDIVRQLQGTQTDRALVAWGKVFDAVQRVGAYESVGFDDPVIHAAVVDMGGWSTVCRSGVDELPFLQRRFCETYRAHAARPTLAYPSHLVGEFEAKNRLAGQPVAPPLLIGDPDRAAAVLAGGGAPRQAITSAAAVMPALSYAGGRPA